MTRHLPRAQLIGLAVLVLAVGIAASLLAATILTLGQDQPDPDVSKELLLVLAGAFTGTVAILSLGVGYVCGHYTRPDYPPYPYPWPPDGYDPSDLDGGDGGTPDIEDVTPADLEVPPEERATW